MNTRHLLFKINLLYMNFIIFFHSFHFSLFFFSKIAGVYLQNIPRFYFAVTAFLFQLMRFCIVASSGRQFWLFFCFDIIKLITIFCRIDGFTLRKELRVVEYIFPISPHRQKNFLRVKSRQLKFNCL